MKELLDSGQQLPFQALRKVAPSDVPQIRYSIGLDPVERRVAVPPDLIGGELSPENASWLAAQQQKEKDHYRKVSAALGKLGRAR